MTAEERNHILASGEEWRALGWALGWQLHGWDDYRGASFHVHDDANGYYIRLTGKQRDDILRAIASAQEVE